MQSFTARAKTPDAPGSVVAAMWALPTLLSARSRQRRTRDDGFSAVVAAVAPAAERRTADRPRSAPVGGRRRRRVDRKRAAWEPIREEVADSQAAAQQPQHDPAALAFSSALVSQRLEALRRKMKCKPARVHSLQRMTDDAILDGFMSALDTPIHP